MLPGSFGCLEKYNFDNISENKERNSKGNTTNSIM